jgi:hypothetical protein
VLRLMFFLGEWIFLEKNKQRNILQYAFNLRLIFKT